MKSLDVYSNIDYSNSRTSKKKSVIWQFLPNALHGLAVPPSPLVRRPPCGRPSLVQDYEAPP